MKKFFLCFLLAQTSFVSAQNVLYPIIQNSKFGLADANGNIQVQATFDEIDFLRAGFLAVAKNGKWGVIDFKGTEIIPLKYDRVRKLEGSMGTLALARIEQNELEGIIDLGTQKEVLPCKYEAISAVVNGLLAAVLPNEKLGCYYNLSGERVFGDAGCYEYAGAFFEGFAKVGKNGKYALLNKTGELVTEFEYDDIHPFLQGNNYTAAQKNGKWGFINKQGASIGEGFVYKNCNASEGISDLYNVRDEKNKWGVQRMMQRKQIACLYDEEIMPNSFANLFVAVQQKKYGFLDNTGLAIIPFIYDNATDFSQAAGVKKGNKWALIDRKQQTLTPFEYDEISSAKPSAQNTLTFFPAKKGNKWGYLDKTGKPLGKFEYESVYAFKNRYAVVFKDGKGGYINAEGKEIIPPRYEQVYDWGNLVPELGEVAQNGKAGFVDRWGNDTFGHHQKIKQAPTTNKKK